MRPFYTKHVQKHHKWDIQHGQPAGDSCVHPWRFTLGRWPSVWLFRPRRPPADQQTPLPGLPADEHADPRSHQAAPGKDSSAVRDGALNMDTCTLYSILYLWSLSQTCKCVWSFLSLSSALFHMLETHKHWLFTFSDHSQSFSFKPQWRSSSMRLSLRQLCSLAVQWRLFPSSCLQNSAQIPSVLKSLCWLPVSSRIDFQILLLSINVFMVLLPLIYVMYLYPVKPRRPWGPLELAFFPHVRSNPALILLFLWSRSVQQPAGEPMEL